MNAIDDKKWNVIYENTRINHGQDNFEYLPDSLILDIMDYLGLKDRRMILSTCRFLWRLRWVIERNQKVLDFVKNPEEPRWLLLLFPYSKLSKCPNTWNHSYPTIPTTTALDYHNRRELSHDYNVLHINSVWLYLSGFQNVVELTLGSWATDAFLELISQSNNLPQNQPHNNVEEEEEEEGDEITSNHTLLKRLEHLNMRHSLCITDKGLKAISQGGSERSNNLKTIDITFCRNTTYYGTFPLREKLKNLRLIRRQPEWMDGTYITPFDDDHQQQQQDHNSITNHNNGNDTESHTYWADGTFSFSRSTQSSGFVCDLIDWSKDNNSGNSRSSSYHVGDKLQYNDFVPPEGWPSWTRYYYRPGVSLLKLPDSEETSNYTNSNRTVRSVLVAQRLSGIKAPSNDPKLEQSDLIPLGQSRHFCQNGTMCHQLAADRDQQQEPRPYTMISRMRVEPLPESSQNSLMPPPELVLRNKQFCEEMNKQFHCTTTPGIIDGEEIIHSALLWRTPTQS